MSALVTARSSRTAWLRLDTGHCGRRSRLALLHRCNLSPHSHPQTVSNFVGRYAHCTVTSATLRNPPFAGSCSRGPQFRYPYRPPACCNCLP